jgi:hypothetical protein
MGFKFSQQIEYIPNMTANERFILYRLADHCNQHTESTFVSIGRLHRETLLHPRTIQAVINSLEAKKLIMIIRRRGKSSIYTLCVDNWSKQLDLPPIRRDRWGRVAQPKMPPGVHAELEMVTAGQEGGEPQESGYHKFKAFKESFKGRNHREKDGSRRNSYAAAPGD